MADLEKLRDAYRGACDRAGGDHLSEADWERLAVGQSDAVQERRALDHVLSCVQCSQIYRAVAAVRSGAAAFDSEAPAGDRTTAAADAASRFPRRALGFLAMAAVIVVGVALPLLLFRGPTSSDGVVVRSADEAPRIAPIAPVGVVSRLPNEDVTFSWQGVGVDSPFVVEVLDSEGEPVWTGPKTTKSEISWPASRVPGSGRYYWRILAADSPDSVVGSELVAFDLVNASRP